MHPQLSDSSSGFITAVYWQPGEVSVPHLRDEFLRMKESGLDAVRFHNACPREMSPGEWDFSRTDAWFEAARLAEIPVLFHTNLVVPSAAYLTSRGIEPGQFHHLEGRDPLYEDVVKGWMEPVVQHLRSHPCLMGWGLQGEPEPLSMELHSEWDRAPFAGWLRKQYPSLEQLNQCWMPYPDPANPLLSSYEEGLELFVTKGEVLFDGGCAIFC